jgi:hypothetical protein
LASREHISALLNSSFAKRGTVRRETPRTATGTVAIPKHSPASHSGTILGPYRVNQIEEKIKKCQKHQNPCNSGLKLTLQRRPSNLISIYLQNTLLDFS